jgi:hypothetical protein
LLHAKYIRDMLPVREIIYNNYFTFRELRSK